MAVIELKCPQGGMKFMSVSKPHAVLSSSIEYCLFIETMISTVLLLL